MNILSQDCQFLVQEMKEESPGHELGFAMFVENDGEVSQYASG